LRRTGRRYSERSFRPGGGARGAKGEGAFVEGIEDAKFFLDWERGETPPVLAFALKNLGEVKGHGRREQAPP
jgi:hypothetical protein